MLSEIVRNSVSGPEYSHERYELSCDLLYRMKAPFDEFLASLHYDSYNLYD